MYRSKSGHIMEKFPEDVIRAETAVGGDIQILTRDEFQEVKKESYKEIFIDPTKKTTASGKKGPTYLCFSGNKLLLSPALLLHCCLSACLVLL